MLDQVVSLSIVSRPDREGTRQPDRLETEAVEHRGAMLSQRLDVLVGAVSFMPRESELRENGIPLTHAVIPRGLGQNGGGGDALHLRIPMDNGFDWNSEIQRDRVRQEVIAGGIQLGDCTLHGEPRCLIDVDAVYFVHVGGRNGPSERAFANPACKKIAPIRG